MEVAALRDLLLVTTFDFTSGWSFILLAEKVFRPLSEEILRSLVGVVDCRAHFVVVTLDRRLLSDARAAAVGDEVVRQARTRWSGSLETRWSGRVEQRGGPAGWNSEVVWQAGTTRWSGSLETRWSGRVEQRGGPAGWNSEVVRQPGDEMVWQGRTTRWSGRVELRGGPAGWNDVVVRHAGTTRWSGRLELQGGLSGWNDEVVRQPGDEMVWQGRTTRWSGRLELCGGPARWNDEVVRQAETDPATQCWSDTLGGRIAGGVGRGGVDGQQREEAVVIAVPTSSVDESTAGNSDERHQHRQRQRRVNRSSIRPRQHFHCSNLKPRARAPV